MKKGEIMTVNGEDFEYCGKTGSSEHIVETRYDYDDIYKAYSRPSHAKVYIWQHWVHWYNEAQVNGIILHGNIWVSSRNSHFFTISGYIVMSDFETGAIETYDFMITARHNRIWKCEE